MIFLHFLILPIRSVVFYDKETGCEDIPIILPTVTSSKPWIQYAGEQFVDLFNKTTGCTLKWYDEKVFNGTIPDKSIFLYDSEVSRNYFKQSISDETRDFFEIAVIDNKLFIKGGTRGTLYGIFDLFERYFNVRFYASWMTVAQKVDKFELSDSLKYSDEGKTYFREYLFSETYFINGDYANRIRANAGQTAVGDKHGKKLSQGTEKYVTQVLREAGLTLETHPECWALLSDGSRFWKAICWSNEQSFIALRDYFMSVASQTNPPYYIDIEQDDSGEYCHCESCLKKIEQYGTLAGIYVEVGNRILEYASEKYPNQLLRIIAYLCSRAPPTNGITPHKNLHVRFAPLELDYSHPIDTESHEQNQLAKTDFDNWKTLTPNVMVWEYSSNINQRLWVYPMFGAILGNINYYQNKGIVGYMAVDEIPWYRENGIITPYYHQFMVEYKLYLLSKNAWNNNRNQTELSKDFLTGYYGRRASPYINQFLEEIQEIADKNTQLTFCYSTASWFFTEKDLIHYKWLWDKAYEECQKDTYDERYVYNVLTSMISVYDNLFYKIRTRTHNYIWDDNISAIRPQLEEYESSTISLLKEFCIDNKYNYPRRHECTNDIDHHYNEYIPLWQSSNKGQIISTSSLIVMTSDSLSGRCGLLKYNNYNYLDGDLGGIDTYHLEGPNVNTIPNPSLYDIKSQTSTSITYNLTNTQREIIKTYSVSGNVLTFTSSYESIDGTTVNRPVYTFVIKAENDTSKIAWKLNSNEWKSKAIADDMDWDFFGEGEQSEVKGGTLLIGDCDSNRGLQITFPSLDFEFCTFIVNKTTKSIKILLSVPSTTSKVTASFQITPITISGYEEPIKPKNRSKYKTYRISELIIPWSLASHRTLSWDNNSQQGRALKFSLVPQAQLYLYKSVIQLYAPLNTVYNISFHARCDLSEGDNLTKQVSWFGYTSNGNVYYQRK
ncbi:DUF4838 domain-containing protein [Histomonas meleagridis]|nr:DUF4838 domain-containing protein [Histomonas meleagridis]